ncbi:hypothetical protein Tcan_06242 [Toxocara canis]|uniref:Uncharacterized protein n=1 Tax=Toxocara canis TaxID=6265 RepID=A0A0B2VV96_TOXCA|nr:hypothetical protein Tcan_06242 [Toxocara canis]
MGPNIIAVTWYQVLYLITTLVVLSLCSLAVCTFCVCFGRILDCIDRRNHQSVTVGQESDAKNIYPTAELLCPIVPTKSPFHHAT